eukprot:TRINITY_DN91167_c0_g1_i1.p1 TRINITY_DN91167_c0_g1~~TRINITY_DN91167_c0_g1_i1.p1  ORF type:complete len:190 (-),score=33.77 TRINITY_DN91167_c0_g1_i1:8-577(-)
MATSPEGVFIAFVNAIAQPKYLRLAGMAGACSMLSLASLSLLDLQLSLRGLPCVSQIALLLAGGLACFQGQRSEQSQQLSWQEEVVRQHLGFAMVPAGRAVAYSLALLHGAGVHATKASAADDAGHSAFFSSLWAICCTLLFVATAASLWSWRQPSSGGNPGCLIDVGIDGEDARNFSYERVYEPPPAY